MTEKSEERHAQLELCIPYVFGRLNPGNRKQFESHLAGGCDQCNKELSELYEATALLPLLLRQEAPSADLRQSVLGRASSREQDQSPAEQPRSEQPRTDQPRADQPRSDRSRPGRPRQERTHSEQPRSERSRSEQPRSGRSRSEQSRSEQPRPERQAPPREKPVVSPALRGETHWYRYASIVLGILLIVALIIFVNDLLGTTGEQAKSIASLQAEVARQETMLGVLQEPQASMSLLSAVEPSSTAYGKIIWDPVKRSALVQASHLPALPEGKQYQVWVEMNKKFISAGLFDVAGDKASILTLMTLPAGDKGEIEGFAVTAEPKGGSSEPTAPIILRSLVK